VSGRTEEDACEPIRNGTDLEGTLGVSAAVAAGAGAPVRIDEKSHDGGRKAVCVAGAHHYSGIRCRNRPGGKIFDRCR